MAKIKITWVEQKFKSKIVDAPFNEDLLLQDIGDYKINTERQLRNAISGYFEMNEDCSFLLDLLTKEEKKDYYSDIECNKIFNLDELVKEYSYLIEEEETPTCCEDQTTAYCPHCGTKLK